MSMPFYVSPEQLMKDKADYARKGIARGRSVVVLQYDRGIAFVPSLAGLGCPHWNRAARGAWLGLGLGDGKPDMMQALLEGVALRTSEVLAAMHARRLLHVPAGEGGNAGLRFGWGELEALLALPLVPSWRRLFERRLAQGAIEDWNPRLQGPARQ